MYASVAVNVLLSLLKGVEGEGEGEGDGGKEKEKEKGGEEKSDAVVCDEERLREILRDVISLFHRLMKDVTEDENVDGLQSDDFNEKEGVESRVTSRDLLYPTLLLIDTLSSLTPSASSLLLEEDVICFLCRLAEGERKREGEEREEEGSGTFLLIASLCRHIILWQMRLSVSSPSSPSPSLAPFSLFLSPDISPVSSPSLSSLPSPLPLSLPLTRSLTRLLKLFARILRLSSDEESRSACVSSLSLIFLYFNTHSSSSPSSPSPPPSSLTPFLSQWDEWYADVMDAILIALSGSSYRTNGKEEGRKEKGEKEEKEKEKEKEKGEELLVRSARERVESNRKEKGTIEEVSTAREKEEKEEGEKNTVRRRGEEEKMSGYLLASLLIQLVTPSWPLITSSPSPSPSPSLSSSPSALKLSLSTESQFLCSLLHFCNRDLQMKAKGGDVTAMSPLTSLIVNVVALLIHISNADKMEELGGDWWRENGNAFGKIRSILNEVFLTNLEVLTMCKNTHLFPETMKDDEVGIVPNCQTIAISICAPILRDHLLFGLDDVTSATRKVIQGLFDYFVFLGKCDDFAFLSVILDGLYHYFGIDDLNSLRHADSWNARKSFGEFGGDALLLEYIDNAMTFKSGNIPWSNVRKASLIFIFLHSTPSTEVSAPLGTPYFSFKLFESSKNLGEGFFSKFEKNLRDHFPSSDSFALASDSLSLLSLYFFLFSVKAFGGGNAILSSALPIAEACGLQIVSTSSLASPQDGDDWDDEEGRLLILLVICECILQCHAMSTPLSLNQNIWKQCGSIASSKVSASKEKSRASQEIERVTETLKLLSITKG